MSKELEGGCLCGNVRFRTSQAPMRTLACHCTFCQRMTGTSYYAESIFEKNAVAFNDGRMNCYQHISDGSRKKVFVHFCTNCGTTVTLTFERWPDMRAISRGCFDDPNAVEVTSHIWTQSAQAETALPEGVECFAGARMSLEGQAEPSTKHTSPVMAPLMPNPSVKRSANGMPPGPRSRYGVHFHRPGLGVLPLSPA